MVIVGPNNYITPLPSVQICNQVWTTKNLEVTTYANGDPIPEVADPTQWSNLTTGAWCYYNNNPVNGTIYGKLYNWFAINDPRGLAPLGWHIASQAEFNILIACAGGPIVGGDALKETGSTHWSLLNNGTNSTGFTALGAGYRDRFGSFLQLTLSGITWGREGAAAGPDSVGNYLFLSSPNSAVTADGSFAGKAGASVRLIQNQY